METLHRDWLPMCPVERMEGLHETWPDRSLVAVQAANECSRLYRSVGSKVDDRLDLE